MQLETNYEARAEQMLQYLIWGWSIPWYKTKVDMKEIRAIWRDEHMKTLTGKEMEDTTLDDRLRSDVQADWRQFLWDWCVEAAQVERR